MRCVRHHLLGCALCGPSGKGVVSATPPREREHTSVRIFDFGLATFESKVFSMLGVELTDEERAAYIRTQLTKRAEEGVPEYDTGDPSAIMAADVISRSTRGRVYEVHHDTAKCPKCAGRVDLANLSVVSGYAIRIPNFSKCPQCERDEARMEGCAECDGRGWVISSWTSATAYLACSVCVARMRAPTKRGSATNFTTTSRAGEEYARKEQRDKPLCTACQQRYATLKGTGLCTQCRGAELHREARGIQREIARLKGEAS